MNTPLRTGHDSLQCLRTLDIDGDLYDYFSLPAAAQALGGDFPESLARLPFTFKILLENLLRHEDSRSVTTDDIRTLMAWSPHTATPREVAFRPVRVLMQDFTGVPAVVDLAAMREAMQALGGDPMQINPLSNVDLIIDHSVTVDSYGGSDSFRINVMWEFERNTERYAFLKWGQKSFENFRVVPPGTGICHQVNLEYLSQTVWHAPSRLPNGRLLLCPDTVVGTDSHTTMINGLAVLGWGVGGIEAEAAMLGQPVSMLVPDVIGFRLTGALPEGSTATDLVLTITEMLRKRGVVGAFVEFCGDGLDHLTLADRATIANMSPEFGSTCAFFPIDQETLDYLTFTGRGAAHVARVESYAKAQGLWREKGTEPIFTDMIALDLATVLPTIAGPKRPQDKILLSNAAQAFAEIDTGRAAPVTGVDYTLKDGDVVIAAITSCTNTSNPSVMIAAGLVARNARERGLSVRPWVKTSLAPGSQVVTDYLEKAGLQADLDALGFHLVGYGCTTCIGNSGPLPEPLAEAVTTGDLNVCGVLSGNRNFEGRINSHVRSNYLASPPLVVAYAIAGSLRVDLTREPLGQDTQGRDVFLKDIWPSRTQIRNCMAASLTPDMFLSRYGDVFQGTPEWQEIPQTQGETYTWDPRSTYVRNPPYFIGMTATPEPVQDIAGARCLALLGDSVTTDHISPAGAIRRDSPAGLYLMAQGVEPPAFNSYGARRGNHEVMMRGTFANIRIRNEMVPHLESGYTRHIPSGQDMAIYDAAMAYAHSATPLVLFAGQEYGTGSSRDWAAKGTRLLGVRAVIAESFERIHRSNLIGMGVLPLVFENGTTRKTLNLTGDEFFDITGLSALTPQAVIHVHIRRPSAPDPETVPLRVRIDTLDEMEYFRHGGILHAVLRAMAGTDRVPF